jgi:GNAT superfamily N-acetyltransferase
MEIRTLAAQERLTIASMLDGWTIAEGWTAGDRFRQQVELDPTYADENVLVATERGRPIAAVTILPRHLRILGHAIPAGGLGGLFTDPAARGRGVATELLERACETMRSAGLELGLIFPGAPPATAAFYAKRGWHTWGGQQTILRRHDGAASLPADAAPCDEIELEPVRLDSTRVLQSVKSIHAAYGASRSGTVVRDDALWAASLQLTSAPREEFWIARRGGLAVAYARVALIDDVLTITELGRFEDGAEALARLIASLLEPRDDDPLATARVASQELRSFLVVPTFDDIGLIVALEERAIRSHPMAISAASYRCVNLIGLAARLDVDLLPDEDGVGFLRRILPPDSMVFWPADRF